MNQAKLLLLLFHFCFLIQLTAQPEFPELGVYSEAELNLKECAFDKEAEAIILLDQATSDYDDEYRLITTRRIRIKILNEKGIEWANIKIPFYSKDKFEIIYNIEGLTYNHNMNGQQQEIKTLDKKQIFTEKVNEYFSLIKFAMPAVKAGSIIEYRYTSAMKNYGGLQTWIFQSTIPTLLSAYTLTVLPNAEFTYFVTKKREYEIKIIPKQGTGQIYFQMNDIPGLRSEPFMNAPKDYFQRVEFQLSGYKSYFGHKENVSDTWAKLAKELDDDNGLGGALKKDLPGLELIKAIAAKETSQLGKIASVYDYVQSNFTWDGNDSRFTSETLKKIIERKLGTAADLNLLFINILQLLNIEAYPMLVAERSFGSVDVRFPILDRFNKTVAYVVVDDKSYIMDITDKFCPPNLIPYSLLNTQGLIINRNTKKPILIASGDQSFNSRIIIKSQLDKTGVLNGDVSLINKQYALQYYRSLIQDEKSFIQQLSNENHDAEINELKIDTTDTNFDSLALHLKFSKDFSDNSGFILLNYNFFTGQNKNPFIRDVRFSDINFGYPLSLNVTQEITLPPGASIDDLPKNKTIVTPEKDFSFRRKLNLDKDKLNIIIEFFRTSSFYASDNYPLLKDFYQEMLKLLNEPVSIKLAPK
jgi:hypothetical protein